ncbi:uncharacterized protein MELLADRAFT_114278 [Melampsora larici-populina 98AG31]|uniref:Uncharacterized protein n=1 Tax=Melampsora larici-populina (strain 98AG31 / pathotype 3-4-7) TaxID=747676 RepID=F4SCW2_MELLP|nr:uncharacterized protein MELLADRAFT_114278 [Melampsora larici-populina 98AG31]EGF97514.1 hypothetical protein MELLADRAFT_114278 [Melampsora larici-populina 98AG31]
MNPPNPTNIINKNSLYPYARVEAYKGPLVPIRFTLPYIPPSYAKNARIRQRPVLGNITKHRRLTDSNGDSTGHAHFNNRHVDYSNTYDFTQESPLKNSAERVDSVYPVLQKGISPHTCMVQFNVDDNELPSPYEIYQESLSTDPTKVSNGSKPQNSRSSYFTHEVTGFRSLDLTETAFVAFKQNLFKLANDIDDNEDLDGISSILEGADGTGGIAIQIHIPGHNVYPKGKGVMLKTEEQLKSFFKAVELSPQNEPRIVVTMEDPSKQALKDEKRLSGSQARLVAQTIKNTGNEPSNSKLVMMIPEDPTDVQIGLLMKEYGTGSNNTKEGYRVHHPINNCKVMQLTFEHLYLWAQELAKGTVGVTLQNPPNMDGFVWELIKRPIETTTPMKSNKRMKSDKTQKACPSQPDCPYSELQGHYDFTIERDLLERFKKQTTLGNYLLYACVPPDEVEEVTKLMTKICKASNQLL